MSTLPVDIARLPWRRRASDAWTDAAFRGTVLTFLAAFLDGHPWASSWEVTERFTDTAHALRASSVNVRVPAGPTGPPAVEDFKQRDGDRLLVFAFTRARDQFRAEVAVPFPFGSNTPSETLASLLVLVRQSAEQEEKRNR